MLSDLMPDLPFPAGVTMTTSLLNDTMMSSAEVTMAINTNVTEATNLEHDRIINAVTSVSVRHQWIIEFNKHLACVIPFPPQNNKTTANNFCICEMKMIA